MAFENKTKEFRRLMQAEIIQLLQEGGLTLEEISRQCCCTLSTVYNTARKNGLRRKDRQANAEVRES
jgi:DNA-directed RNA polymerase specialized sigma24 family protein